MIVRRKRKTQDDDFCKNGLAVERADNVIEASMSNYYKGKKGSSRHFV